MKIYLTKGSAWLMMLLPAAYSQDIMISSNTFTAGFGQRSIFSQAKFDFGIYGYFLFDNIHFGNQNVGDIYAVSSDSQDPNFSLTVNFLENGTNGFFEAGLDSSTGIGGLTSISEAQLFPGLNGETLPQAGYQIQSFSFQIDSLSIQSPGSNPNGDGIWTDMSGQVSLMIYATQVPKPATMSLFGIGSLLAICTLRTGRRQKQIQMTK
jgi:hypothetical protein